MKIACIDVGLKRIGLAYSPNEKVVIPVNAILRKNRNQAAREVNLFLKEWQIDKLVVGLPENEEMQRRIKHFVSLIEFGDIVFENEDYSSVEVEEEIKGKMKYKRDGRIDSLAAKNILHRYLEKIK